MIRGSHVGSKDVVVRSRLPKQTMRDAATGNLRYFHVNVTFTI